MTTKQWRIVGPWTDAPCVTVLPLNATIEWRDA